MLKYLSTQKPPPSSSLISMLCDPCSKHRASTTQVQIHDSSKVQNQDQHLIGSFFRFYCLLFYSLCVCLLCVHVWAMLPELNKLDKLDWIKHSQNIRVCGSILGFSVQRFNTKLQLKNNIL